MGKMQSFKKNKCNIEESLPCSSSGNESACNVGDPGLIPGSGRSSGEVFLPGEFQGQRSRAGLQSMESQRVGQD